MKIREFVAVDSKKGFKEPLKFVGSVSIKVRVRILTAKAYYNRNSSLSNSRKESWQE